jgi:hypothetical protein
MGEAEDAIRAQLAAKEAAKEVERAQLRERRLTSSSA